MAAWYRELTDVEQLRGTVERLARDGELTREDADLLVRELPSIVRNSGYVLQHLGAHLAIGVIFAFDVIPLPLGTISRGVWVVASRCYESIRNDAARARIHSLPVLGVALIPVIGYFAYLIPLRTQHADATYVLANHITYRRNDCPLSMFLSRRSGWVRNLVNSIVVAPRRTADSSPVPGPNSADESKAPHETA